MIENKELENIIESFRNTLILVTLELGWSNEQIINYLGCSEEELIFIRLIN